MDYQGLFEKALRAVIAQGEPSILPTGTCAYMMFKGEKELRCAVGHLLSDRIARRYSYSGMGIRMLKKEGIDLGLGEESDRDINFLTSLQTTHDRASSMADFMNAYIGLMRDVAAQWSLVFPTDV